ncbi:MAG: ATP-binding protein [Candidatus Methanoperedens sp.]|nr:ATP-binding protein [Candidatus Methanoperedens sp.]
MSTSLKHVIKLLSIMIVIFITGYFIEISNILGNSFIILSEFFIIFASFSVFTLTWFAYGRCKDDHTLFMGTTFLIIGVFELFHVLSYPFMPDFFTINTPQKASIFKDVIQIIVAPLFLISAYLYKDTLQLLNKNVLYISAILLSIIPLTSVYYIGNIVTNYPAMNSPQGDATILRLSFLLLSLIMIFYAAYIYSNRFRQSEEESLILFVYGFISIGLGGIIAFIFEIPGILLECTGLYFVYLALHNSYIELPYDKLLIAEASLKEARDGAENANKVKSEFLSTMSHELRTPLNSIIGFSDLLKQKMMGELNPKQEHYIDNILNSSKHLLSLINDILDLSKIESGKIEMNVERISLPAAIKDTLEMVKTTAMKHNIKIIKEFDPDLEFIEADKQKLKQIFFNLLSNAVKFSKKNGGSITIITKKLDEMVQISVSDSGVGIKKEDMGKLFNKFQQIESATHNKYGGTGLGLAISKELVELHGGKIMAESKYGDGTTFILKLPLKSKLKAG